MNRREATARLLERARQASGEERCRLEDEVVRLNMSVAGDLARRYRGRGIPLDDLEQVACLGLVKAVKGFEPDKASDFLSFAVPTIRGELRRYFRDFGWVGASAAVDPGAAGAESPRRSPSCASSSGDPRAQSEIADPPRRRARQGARLAGRERMLRAHVARFPRRRRRRHRSPARRRGPWLRRGRGPGRAGAAHSPPRRQGAADPRDAVLPRLHPGRDRRRRSASPRCRCPGCSPACWRGCVSRSTSPRRALTRD